MSDRASVRDRWTIDFKHSIKQTKCIDITDKHQQHTTDTQTTNKKQKKPSKKALVKNTKIKWNYIKQKHVTNK
jgi:hypothetical protein